MADNRIPETRHPADADYKTEDPLAELARIVGFESEQTEAVVQDAAPEAAESGFDLEAELMRELEIDVSDDPQQSELHTPQPSPEPTPEPLQMAAPHQPVEEFVTASEEPFVDDQGTGGAWPHAAEEPAQQLNSLEAELQAAFSALEGKRPEPAPVADPPVEPPVAEPVAPAAEMVAEAAPVDTPVLEADPFEQAAAQLQSELAAETVPVMEEVQTFDHAPAAEPALTSQTPHPVQEAQAAEAAPATPVAEAAPFIPTAVVTEPTAAVDEAAPAAEIDSGWPIAPDGQPTSSVHPLPVEAAPAVQDVLPDEDLAFEIAASEANAEDLKESDQLKEAYDRLQRDIEAAQPQEVELGDSEDQLTEMLLAEMAEVESEATASMPVAEDIPFDPSDIADSEDVPEAMADLEVPEYEEEPVVPLHGQENDFDLPLEDELAALSSPEPFEQPVPRQAQPDVDRVAASAQATPMAEAVAAAAAATQQQYDDDPGMDEYAEEFDEDVFPGDEDFIPEDLLAPNYGEPDDSNQGSGRKGLVAAIVVLGVAALGGGGFYLWNGGLGEGGLSGGPKVIAANNDPVKVKPEDPGGKTVPNEDLAVYDKVDGNDTTGGDNQQLVDTTEEPVDVVRRTLSPDALPLEGRPAAGEPASKIEERLGATESLDPDPAAPSATTGVAPRKVRTLVVRPDGTIVARDEPAAENAADETAAGTENNAAADLTTGTTTAPQSLDNGAATAPASTGTLGTAGDGQSLPTVIAEPLSNGDSNAGPIDASETTGQEAGLPPIDENLRNTGATPLPQARPVEVASVATDTQSATDAGGGQAATTTQQSASTPIPTTRPSEQPVNVVEAVTDRGNLAGTTQVSNPGGYMMQISSQPSEEAARATYEQLSQRYASIIGGRGVEYQRANIENRGVFYRVRIPAGSKEAANTLCTQYKSAGGNCFIAR